MSEDDVGTIRERARRQIEQDLIASRAASQSYAQLIHYLGARDAVTRSMLEDVRAAEEEHARELAELRREWQQQEARSGLAWEAAQQEPRDAWDRLAPGANDSGENR
jgi:bacterioferritin (cytochrome b1)